MAIKWGSTYVTVVKWGNTVCTQVKWGNTVVFPTGGYAGSEFSPPLIGGMTSKIVYNSTDYYQKTITSGTLTNSGYVTVRSSGYWANIVFTAINKADFTKYNNLKLTFSCTKDTADTRFYFSRIDCYSSSNSISFYSGDSGTTKSISGYTSADYNFQIIARFTISKGSNISSTITATITSIEFS
jgi:hypothetical protein